MEIAKEKTAKTIGTVREKERELHFSKLECGFIQQSSTRTSNFIGNKKGCNAFSIDVKNSKQLAMCNVNMAD